MNNTKSNKNKILNLVKILSSFAFMVFIIYYFFGKNSESLKRDLLKVEYIYIILSIFTLFLVNKNPPITES